MPPNPENDTGGYDHLHHLGTIQPDGATWLDAWPPPFGGMEGAFGDFAGLYPFPAFGPPLDAIVPAPAHDTTTTTAATVGTISGAQEGNDATQAAGFEPSQADPLGEFVIIPTFDSSITSSTLAANIESAITTAISFYEAEITTPITLDITFSYGSIDGQTLEANALGESQSDGQYLAYSEFEPELQAHDTTIAGATPLPASDPFSPGDAYFVTVSQQQALGVLPSDGLFDGYVALGTANFDFNGTGSVQGNEYYAVGVLEHEISEVMGRDADYAPNTTIVAATTSEPAITANIFSPLDLFRYTGAGDIATTGTAAYFSINDGNTDLAEFNNNTKYGGDPGDWSSQSGDINPVLHDSYDAFSSIGVANTVSATDLTVMDALGYSLAAACYAAGTRILGARGEVPIEDLVVGDLVRTRFAGLAQIRWIGHRRIDCRRHPDPREVWPVQVAAGAFGPGQPVRDLRLSPDHAVAVGDALIPVRLLANGASIRQQREVAEIRYFHLELDRHDLLRADGLEAESYLDTGNRGMFSNADLPLLLHPRQTDPEAQQRREAMSCLKLCCDPADVEPVWQALAARAERLGFVLPEMATTPDPDLCVVAGGRRFAPILRDGDHYTFVLPALPGGARLESRCAVPSELRPWLEDRRRLGVMVHRLVFCRGATVTDVALDDPCLTDGWWATERDATTMWRWTDGDAVLPCIDALTILKVVLGETVPYPLNDPAPIADPRPDHRSRREPVLAAEAGG